MTGIFTEDSDDKQKEVQFRPYKESWTILDSLYLLGLSLGVIFFVLTIISSIKSFK